MKEKVLSITKDDLEWSYFSVSGAGGQGRDRSNSGARCLHVPSGASGRATESRSQRDNRRTALKRLAKHPKFRFWISEQLKHTKTQEELESEVDAMMKKDSHFKTEVKKNKKWVEVDPSELT